MSFAPDSRNGDQSTPRTRDRSTNAVPKRRQQSERATNSSQRVLLDAVRTVLRGQNLSELPAHGINVVFDAGIVVICRTCHISWEVSRRQFSNLAWWSCPRGCRPGADVDTQSPTRGCHS